MNPLIKTPYRLSRLLPAAVLCVALIHTAARAAEAAPLKVAASILPLHGLVANLVDEAALLDPLLPPTASPHHYALRPSQARHLRQATVIFWFGPTLESVLARPLAALPQGTRVISLLSPVEDGIQDPHVWLDPVKAKVMVERISATLSELDPARAGEYRRRATELLRRLDSLTAELDAAFAPVRDEPFVTAHAAYAHLEHRFGLRALGALTRGTDHAPGARQLGRMRQAMERTNARCLFAEPQYQPQSLLILASETAARVVVVDPLGSAIQPGPDAYFVLMRQLAARMISCLGRPTP
ncbi:MAG: hypothetical protein D6763_10985 [Alphaproteobacteria bacterium]|nr:MAG: hypothetical protein D6763_10985 [Alphaproteobacteria bacterium]